MGPLRFSLVAEQILGIFGGNYSSARSAPLRCSIAFVFFFFSCRGWVRPRGLAWLPAPGGGLDPRFGRFWCEI